MNATDRVLQRCAVAAIHGRKNAKYPWTTPFVAGHLLKIAISDRPEICVGIAVTSISIANAKRRRYFCKLALPEIPAD